MVVDGHCAVGDLQDEAVQLHADGADGGGASHVHGEALVASSALRHQDVFTAGRQLEEASIKGLVVVPPPRRAHSADVRHVGCTHVHVHV